MSILTLLNEPEYQLAERFLQVLATADLERVCAPVNESRNADNATDSKRWANPILDRGGEASGISFLLSLDLEGLGGREGVPLPLGLDGRSGPSQTSPRHPLSHQTIHPKRQAQFSLGGSSSSTSSLFGRGSVKSDHWYAEKLAQPQSLLSAALQSHQQRRVMARLTPDTTGDDSVGLTTPLSAQDLPGEDEIIADTDADATMEAMAPLDLLFQDNDGPDPTPIGHSVPTSAKTHRPCWEPLFPPLADSLQSPDFKTMAALRDHAAEAVDLQSAMSKLSIDLPSAVLGKTSWNSISSVLQGLSGASGRGVNYKIRTISSDGASGSLAKILRSRS
jgi:hypothetical protein